MTKVFFKACVPYFLSNFYFFTNCYLFKNYKKMVFISSAKLFFTQDIQIFVDFPFLSTFSRFKRTNGSEIIYVMDYELTCINLQIKLGQ